LLFTEVPNGEVAMLLSTETSKSLARIREDLPKACAAHGFGVLGTIDLEERLREKGVVLGSPAVVFEVCNPHQAKRVLDLEPSLSTMLPCRISVYARPDRSVHLATIAPTALVGLLPRAAGLAPVAREVEESLAAILRAAAR
jgi:uncharacterized protein (DUF302 family)